MKSLLRFVLLFALIVLGKLSKQPDSLFETAKSSRINVQTPIRNTVLINSQVLPKSTIGQSSSGIWQTSPVLVSNN